MVNKYYDLATSFYEYGWGESFHFAHRYRWETLRESIIRHEHFLVRHEGRREVPAPPSPRGMRSTDVIWWCE